MLQIRPEKDAVPNVGGVVTFKNVLSTVVQIAVSQQKAQAA